MKNDEEANSKVDSVKIERNFKEKKFDEKVKEIQHEKNVAKTMIFAGVFIGVLVVFIVVIHVMSTKRSGLTNLM